MNADTEPPNDPASLRCALAETLARTGALTDPAWRAAVESVPRHRFLGTAVFRQSGTLWKPVHRDQTSEDAWLQLAYSDETLVTQVDGLEAAGAPGPLPGRPTSSSTLPSLILRMAELSGVSKGERVLWVGTGTGYSTALVSHVVGAENVTSIEYDPKLARLAADRLHGAGYRPHLVTGDGLQGHKANAPYDALVATCAVRSIPGSWMRQVRDGGTLTLTLSGWMLASGLIRLTLDEEGGATGHFTDDRISFMLARPHERPPRPTFFRREGVKRRSQVDPGLLSDWTAQFVAQLAAPSAELMTMSGGVILVDTATGSQAWTEPSGDGWDAHQHGPLNLWDQVENALLRWQEAGAPDQSTFGMTVTPDLTQTVWINSPDGPSWQLPA
ncbi:ATP-grasp peptide maturase system methyltransferase [Streptomyces yunnanensis]|uniref:Protein-L-isoaspartate O-methyltransferase n=1 Tax=Streptomyces yunnanensis TaxID=156453 RepID=A0ABY8A7T5_9ACTN|nr:ATP-grasp peptide maturase system methyltransferase [Streptomyces yunnanensis]WEB40756.1 ATP-grasp peptide maturase system methyltransferase [Streptomyces yunnanensis]